MKLQIDNSLLTENFFSDTRLLGIMAPVKNYQFAWQLNNMGFHFRLSTENEKQLRKKNRQYYFSVYQHAENNFLNYFLYHNHCDGEYLLPEFKYMDFLLLTKGDFVDDDQCQNIIHTIKSLQSVQLVTELTNEKIKNKEHLVF